MFTANGTYRTSVQNIRNTGSVSEWTRFRQLTDTVLYANMFISLYTTRLILNALGAEDFGIFNIVGGAIAMLGLIILDRII